MKKVFRSHSTFFILSLLFQPYSYLIFVSRILIRNFFLKIIFYSSNFSSKYLTEKFPVKSFDNPFPLDGIQIGIYPLDCDEEWGRIILSLCVHIPEMRAIEHGNVARRCAEVALIFGPWTGEWFSSYLISLNPISKVKIFKIVCESLCTYE